MTNDQHNRKQQEEKQNEKETQNNRDWGEGLTPEMEEMLEEFFKKYDKALRNLKDR